MLNSGYLWLNGTRVWSSSCPIKTYLLAEGYFTTSFSVEDFFHPRLVRILQDHYPEQQAKVEHKCTKWTHPKHESHWSIEAHITRWNEFLLVHVWWNPFIRLSVTASISMLAYLMLPIKLFWHIMESTTKRGWMANKSIFLVVHLALCNVWWLTPTWSRMNN